MLLFAGGEATSQAQQLQWESQDAHLYPSPTDTAAVAHFRFKNIGKEYAEITSVKSSCNCTVPALDKKKYAPGEEGDIAVKFTIGSRMGLQEKAIVVTSNDPDRPKTVLKMKVSIPEMLRLSPVLLYWSPSDLRTSKTVDLTVLNDYPVEAITVESSDPAITAKIEPVMPRQQYRITVTPDQASPATTATVKIKTDYPRDNPRAFFISVRVQPK